MPSRPDPLREALAFWRDLGVRELHLRAPTSPEVRASLPVPATPVEPPVPVTRDSLETIRIAVEACTRCPLCRTRSRTVFSDGRPMARIVFVGEAPGADEDAQGVPFVGRAGQLLTKMIEGGMGIPRRDVYVCNVLKCRPPGNRNPLPEEIEACRPYLEAQIDAVKPEAIVALGKFAAQFLLGTSEGIMRIRGTWGSWRGIPVMPTFHPSFLLRQPDRKKEAWEDLLSVLGRLGLPAPPSARR